jgi:acyl-CoA synthetase (AMP-forming)/AMP-acid ligase II
MAAAAIIVLREGARLGEDDVLGFCREKLASYKVPNSVEFVGELPHMVSGKLAKHELGGRPRG